MPTHMKIDGKISELISWSQKYPKAKANLAGDCTKNIVREYAPTEAERKDFEKQYKTIQGYYEYVRIRKSRRKINTRTDRSL